VCGIHSKQKMVVKIKSKMCGSKMISGSIRQFLSFDSELLRINNVNLIFFPPS